jgi:hypothetical protein
MSLRIGDRVRVNAKYPFPQCYPSWGFVTEFSDPYILVSFGNTEGLFATWELDRV